MEIRDVVRDQMGNRMFLAKDLLPLIPDNLLPSGVRYAQERGGKAVVALGWWLKCSPDFQEVGSWAGSRLWSLK